MSRYIDADALIEELERCSYETWSKDVNCAWWAHAVKVKDNIVKCIDRQPTADVVEVVRCKDCEYCSTSIDPKTKISVQVCGYVGYNPVQSSQVMDNDYCSRGERREE